MQIMQCFVVESDGKRRMVWGQVMSQLHLLQATHSYSDMHYTGMKQAH